MMRSLRCHVCEFSKRGDAAQYGSLSLDTETISEGLRGHFQRIWRVLIYSEKAAQGETLLFSDKL